MIVNSKWISRRDKHIDSKVKLVTLKKSRVSYISLGNFIIIQLTTFLTILVILQINPL